MRTISSALLLIIVSQISAADWPRFRGPNGSGVVADSKAPLRWTASDVVKAPIPGKGNSSPIISKGKVFLQSASASGGERMLICLDAVTLKQEWVAKVPGGVGKTHAKNTLASSTPAADGKRIVCLFWDGSHISLHAFNYDGKELWSTPLGSFTSQHGAGQSPVLHGNNIYLNNDQDGQAQFQCFDAVNGKKVWSAKRPAFRACYSSPFVRQGRGGKAEVVIASTAGITAYQPADGKMLWDWTWQFEKKPLRNVGSPVEGAGVIFAIAGDGDGSRHLVAVTPPGDRNETPKLAWERTRGTPYVPCPLIHGDYVYWVSDNGFAVCAEAKTGRIAFDERFTSGVTASPVLINGTILCIDERGSVFTFPAEPKFTQPKRYNLGEGVSASPAVADGRLYIRGQQHLFMISGGKQ